MKIRLLKRLRKEAYKIYGALEIINDFDHYEYMVGKRQYLENYKEHADSCSHCTFLTDAIKALAKYRQSYIQRQINQLRRKEREKLLAYRNKEWKKL